MNKFLNKIGVSHLWGAKMYVKDVHSKIHFQTLGTVMIFYRSGEHPYRWKEKPLKQSHTIKIMQLLMDIYTITRAYLGTIIFIYHKWDRGLQGWQARSNMCKIWERPRLVLLHFREWLTKQVFTTNWTILRGTEQF